MTASLSDESNAEPNMTPILDMVFQLITFFMLVVNFKGAALDQSLQLPILGSAQPVDSAGGESLLVLNIDTKGSLKLYGAPQETADYIKSEARTAYRAASYVNPNLKAGDGLPTTVVVRADRTTPVQAVNDIVAMCQKHGFRNFSFRAMNRPEGE